MTAVAIRDYRIARGESQKRFWARFGVTQSRGSRFELGSDIPAPVAILLRLYWAGVVSEGDLWQARRRQSGKRSGPRLRAAESGPGEPPSPPPRDAK